MTYEQWWAEYSERQSYYQGLSGTPTGYEMARRDARAAYEFGWQQAQAEIRRLHDLLEEIRYDAMERMHG